MNNIKNKKFWQIKPLSFLLRFGLIVYLVIILVLFGAGCDQGDKRAVYLSNQQTLIDGSLYYNEAGCARCHGINYDGKGPEHQSLKNKSGVIVPSFKVMLDAEKTPLDYFRTITMGTKLMPVHAYQSYTDRGRWAMSHFLYSLTKAPHDNKNIIKRSKALRAMQKKLEKIYSKTRRWDMGYEPLENRAVAPKLEELMKRAR